MSKKKILIAISVVLLLCFAVVFTACNDGDDNAPTVNIVYLGDSIAEALIGPSPISERDNYGYYALVGKSNNFNYYNHSVSGHKTSNGMTGNGMKGLFYDFDDDAYEYVMRTKDTDASLFITHVKQADILHISILGNNALQYDLGWLMIEQANIEAGNAVTGSEAYYTKGEYAEWYASLTAAQKQIANNDITACMLEGNPALDPEASPQEQMNDTLPAPIRPSLALGDDGNSVEFEKELDEKTQKYVYENVRFNFPDTKQDIADIVTALKTLNPDAKIIFQKVYNPVFEGTTLLSREARIQLEKIDAKYADIAQVRALAQKLLDKLNGVLDSYLSEHTGAFEILDVTKAFDDIAKSDVREGKPYYGADSKGSALIFSDWTHPSNIGHAVIAAATQKKLEDMGFANPDAVARYKNIRREQINRMFASLDGFNAAAANSAIDAADTYQGVTDAYFAAIAGFTPDYVRK